MLKKSLILLALVTTSTVYAAGFQQSIGGKAWVTVSCQNLTPEGNDVGITRVTISQVEGSQEMTAEVYETSFAGERLQSKRDVVETQAGSGSSQGSVYSDEESGGTGFILTVPSSASKTTGKSRGYARIDGESIDVSCERVQHML